jgi:hypothetical protein
MKNHFTTFNHAGNGGAIGKFPVGPWDTGQGLGICAATTEAAHPCAKALERSTQMCANKAAPTKHNAGHALQGGEVSAHGRRSW